MGEFLQQTGADHGIRPCSMAEEHKKSKHSGGEASKKDRVTETCKLRGTAEWEHAYQEAKLRTRAPLGKLQQRGTCNNSELTHTPDKKSNSFKLFHVKVKISN